MSLKSSCSAKTLVLASVNSEITIITTSLFGTEWRGKKTPVYRFWRDDENPNKFWVILHPGDKPIEIIAEKVMYNGLGGSSANIGCHLHDMGMEDVTVCGFVNFDPDNPEVMRDAAGLLIKTQLASKGIKFVPMSADRTARTLVCLDAIGGTSTLLMEKPREMVLPKESREQLLDQKWEVIVCSSILPHLGLLRFLVELAEANKKAIKSAIPSMALIQNQERAIRRAFKDLLEMMQIYQLNDREAQRWLGVDSHQPILDPREMVNQMITALPRAKKGRGRKVIAIITLGHAGAAVIGTQRREDAFFQPATTELTEQIVDQTGAGDSVHAGIVRTAGEMGLGQLAMRLGIRIGADMGGRIIRVYGGAGDSGMTPTKLVRSSAKWVASIKATYPTLI